MEWFGEIRGLLVAYTSEIVATQFRHATLWDKGTQHHCCCP